MKYDFEKALKKIKSIDTLRIYGKIEKIVGLKVESIGPKCTIGEILEIEGKEGEVSLQVVGFDGDKVISMALGDITGIYQGQRVYSTGKYPGVYCGTQLLGRVINALGEPLDNKGEVIADDYIGVYNDPVNAMHREPITKALSTGIKAIDGLITIGKGQRIGIFSGSGVGKSTLMGMIARNTSADINVIALVGERGRELKDFIENSLGKKGLERSIVVAATSDEPPLIKILASFTATAIAEYFCNLGNDVLLMMDSITRLSMAQREVGLTAGEPPSTKGYTPSVFTMMPKLLERAGNFEGKGSVTGIYTVLVEGDDVTEPISDHARSILDGHIVLSRDLSHRNHYPAIDILGSISRLMKDVVKEDHLQIAGNVRRLLAVYKDAEDLINIGAYAKGSNPDIDLAISKIKSINSFLTQKINESFTFEQTVNLLKAI